MTERIETRLGADLLLAVGQLTMIPVGGAWPAGRRPGVTALYPAVGLVLGADATVSLLLIHWASSLFGDGGFVARAALPLAALVVAAWALETRFLHWDGLGDVADAAWGAHDRTRRLEILADSRSGAFAVTAIALGALLQTAGLSAVLTDPGVLGLALLAAPVLSRASATLAAWAGTPLRSGGLAAAIMGRPDAKGVAVAVLTVGFVLGGVVWVHGVAGSVWAGCALVTAAVVPHILARVFGGVNGDVMGAGIVITETILLLLAGLVTLW